MTTILAFLLPGCKKQDEQHDKPAPGPVVAEQPAPEKGGPGHSVIGALESFNNLDLDGVVSAFSEDVEFALADSTRAPLKGREELKKFLAGIHMTFPDVHMEAKRILNAGDVWVVEVVAAATHQGEFLGQAATQKRLGGQFALFARVKDGLIHESFLCGNPMALLKQIQASGGKSLDTPDFPDEPEVLAGKGDPARIETIRSFFQAFLRNDLAALSAITADDVVIHAYGDGKKIEGLGALRQAMAKESEAFEGKVAVERAVAVGPYVAALVSIRGKLKTDVGPLKATGKSFAERGVDVFRFEGGKIKQWDNYRNLMDLLFQLGLYPPEKKDR